MSFETFENTACEVNFSVNAFKNESLLPEMCTFQDVESFWDFIKLFEQISCHRHSMNFTAFLFIANLLILAFGLVGNFLVIYVVVIKIKDKTASSIFILNLAVADLLLILCCIPATLLANLFMPWIFGNIACKVVAYTQGVSVFCSVYSLVAISFDRFRATHPTLSTTINITTKQAWKIVAVIWTVGLCITFPWALYFGVVRSHLYPNDFLVQPKLPFCRENWDSKSQDILYFFIAHVLLCYLVPLGVITWLNILMWRSFHSNTTRMNLSSGSTNLNNSAQGCSAVQEKLRRKKLRFYYYDNYDFR